jgi:hypothetical protein
MAKIIKMMDLLKKESLELGKVYTDKTMSPFKVNEDENPCWKGYKQLGMKDKGGKQVPNCVPIDEINEMKVNRSKVMKAYNGVLNHMRKVIKSAKLNDDEMYEVTTQLKKWFNKNIM